MNCGKGMGDILDLNALFSGEQKVASLTLLFGELVISHVSLWPMIDCHFLHQAAANFNFGLIPTILLTQNLLAESLYSLTLRVDASSVGSVHALFEYSNLLNLGFIVFVEQSIFMAIGAGLRH